MTPSPTYKLNSEEVSYLSLLLSIIASQNWQAFAHSILHNPTVFQSFCSNLHKSSDLNGMTILHAAVRYNPPQTIIKLLLKFTPDAPSCVDCLGRTPLHVASGTRAEITTIQLLSKHYPSACIVQDEDGKTPLHLACDSTCELFEGDAIQERSPPSLDVIKTLISSYPASVLLEDQDGMSALEHAIFSNAPIKVVKVLQYATRKMSQRKTTTRQRRVSQDDSMVVDNDCGEPQPMMIDNDDEVVVATASHATVIPALKDEFDTTSSSRLCLNRPSRRRGGIVMEQSAMARSA